MTKENTTEPITDPETVVPEVTDAGQGDENSNPNREAAKYRQRAKAAETARDQIAAQLDIARNQIVAAALTGSQPPVTVEALTAAGVNIADLFDDGTLDPARLNTAAKDTATKFGIHRPSAAPFMGMNAATFDTGIPDWQGAFAPKSARG